jgi:ribosomal protein S18 acetylase RimI-like enzyme
MRSVIRLNVLCPDDWLVWRELRLEALREAPYAFSSTLPEWQGAGDIELRWRERLRSVPHNVVAYLDGVPAGMVSGNHFEEPATVELMSMWVAPLARGRGLGDALIQDVVRWTKAQHAVRVVLAVRRENTHAIRLYARNGFVIKGRNRDDPSEDLMTLAL